MRDCREGGMTMMVHPQRAFRWLRSWGTVEESGGKETEGMLEQA